MITHRFISLPPIRHGGIGGRLRVRTWRCGCAPCSEADYSLAEEAWLPRVDDADWGRQQVACFLAVLLVIASMTYISAQKAAAFLLTFNQPVSLGSEWEALASRTGPIPCLLRDWPIP